MYIWRRSDSGGTVRVLSRLNDALMKVLDVMAHIVLTAFENVLEV